jgi:16S rRNA (guanine527-N7)-methyltransferase
MGYDNLYEGGKKKERKKHPMKTGETLPWKEAKEEAESNRERLWSYCLALARGNERARLTGPADPEVLWSDHVLDCAAALPLLPREGRVVDVGTGGGLPGIVWAICRPGLSVTLLDSVSRKCIAVRSILEELGIGNARVACMRSEELARDGRESFDVAAARAVTATGPLVELLSPLVSVGGVLLAFKGPRVHEEMGTVGEKWPRLGLGNPVLYPYDLEGKERVIVAWRKERACPGSYPRNPALLERKPWWR